MIIGTQIRVIYGRLRGKRGEVVKVDGRHAVIRGSFGVATVAVSELEVL